MPAIVAVKGCLTNCRLFLEMAKDTVLRVGNIIPKWGVNILGAVVIDHIVGACLVEDVADSPTNLVLDIRVLIEPDEFVPVVHIQQFHPLARAVAA